jgi:hypothetical protein
MFPGAHNTGHTSMDIHSIGEIGAKFDIAGRFLDGKLLTAGHINDTYVASYEVDGSVKKYVHQRINERVFRDPESLMVNMSRVLDHLTSRWEGAPAPRPLHLIRTRDGNVFCRDEAGGFWRTYSHIDGVVHKTATTASQAEAVAWAFGMFQRDLVDFPSPDLSETIPDFHDTPKRFAVFESACASDPQGRAAACKREIDFALARKSEVGVIQDLMLAELLPKRIVHNDAKIGNVVFDSGSDAPLAILDLDTVMTGSLLHDFGDLVRTMVCGAEEDEKLLELVSIRESYFEAVVRGYFSALRGMLSDAEKAHMVFSGKLISFELGLRFLTDYLLGDVYFKIDRPNHNLDRCRTQFRLVQSLEEHRAALDVVVARIDAEHTGRS